MLRVSKQSSGKKGDRIQPLGELIESTFRRFGLKKQASQWKLVRHWRDIVGDSIAKISQPRFVKSGVLYVSTASSAWASELDFRKPEILALISEHLGETPIREIRFQATSWTREKPVIKEDKASKLTPTQAKKISELTHRIESPAVREAFERVLIQEALRASQPKQAESRHPRSN